MSGDLPPSWALVRLGDVATFIMGQAPPSSETNRSGNGVPFVKAGEFGPERPIIREWTTRPLKRALASDVLICVVGATCGKINLGADCAIGRSVAAIRPTDVLRQDFLFRYLQIRTIALREASSGSAQGVISQDLLARELIPLPPLAEQRRIVARIEALFARTRRARADLLRIAPLAGRHRLAAIMASLGGGSRLDAPGEHGPVQPTADADMAGVWPFDGVPPGWAWRSFSDLFDDVTSSQHKLPQKAYQPAGRFPVIDQGEAEIGGWSDDGRLAYRGSLPAIIFGDHTRAVKFVERPFIQGADGVKVLVPKDGRYHPRFAFWTLKALPLPSKGYSRHMKFLRASFFPVPPLTEQRRIAHQLDRLYSSSLTAEHEAARALSLLDHLEQAILARAFRGELVPQDPNDEPAEALLARIRAGASPAPTRRGRKRVPA